MRVEMWNSSVQLGDSKLLNIRTVFVAFEQLAVCRRRQDGEENTRVDCRCIPDVGHYALPGGQERVKTHARCEDCRIMVLDLTLTSPTYWLRQE